MQHANLVQKCQHHDVLHPHTGSNTLYPSISTWRPSINILPKPKQHTPGSQHVKMACFINTHQQAPSINQHHVHHANANYWNSTLPCSKQESLPPKGLSAKSVHFTPHLGTCFVDSSSCQWCERLPGSFARYS